jgi:hypothetical protein
MFERNEIIAAFEQLPIEHGTVFDNGSRWCGICNTTRKMPAFSQTHPWADKTCLTCTAVWPEYVELLLAYAMDHDNDLDDVCIN